MQNNKKRKTQTMSNNFRTRLGTSPKPVKGARDNNQPCEFESKHADSQQNGINVSKEEEEKGNSKTKKQRRRINGNRTKTGKQTCNNVCGARQRERGAYVRTYIMSMQQ
eukprot:scpid110147/ scgid3746/ 